MQKMSEMKAELVGKQKSREISQRARMQEVKRGEEEKNKEMEAFVGCQLQHVLNYLCV